MFTTSFDFHLPSPTNVMKKLKPLLFLMVQYLILSSTALQTRSTLFTFSLHLIRPLTLFSCTLRWSHSITNLFQYHLISLPQSLKTQKISFEHYVPNRLNILLLFFLICHRISTIFRARAPLCVPNSLQRCHIQDEDIHSIYFRSYSCD